MQHVGSQFPDPGSNWPPLAEEAWSPKHWTTKQLWRGLFLILSYKLFFNTVLKGCHCQPCAMLGFVTSGGADFDPGAETSLDYMELFVQQSFIKV